VHGHDHVEGAGLDDRPDPFPELGGGGDAQLQRRARRQRAQQAGGLRGARAGQPVLDVDLDAVASQRLGRLAGDLEVARAQGIGLARDD
jgi:hypothetical protein